jgi:hypothetical protein
LIIAEQRIVLLGQTGVPAGISGAITSPPPGTEFRAVREDLVFFYYDIPVTVVNTGTNRIRVDHIAVARDLGIFGRQALGRKYPDGTTLPQILAAGQSATTRVQFGVDKVTMIGGRLDVIIEFHGDPA